ncbi:hypothetical protein CEP52_010581 [Fusarium oligoseptatum]|uniref:Uncharacterized protein n=1 Tax=Fusarium oligoseptatum TaxID=2604345 RepID=A0A428T7C5_9HYPO|nr:hypothetical protein CEP52_010581 [Fusarium oligoseptatum]
MASLFATCKTSILKGILTNLLVDDTNGRIVQDALAILSFPFADGVSSMPLISGHIEKWAAQGFNNPFQQSDQATIHSLHSLFSRLILFIEDYLAKATDPFPSRAYMAVPGLVSPGPRFKGKRIDIKPVKFITLNRAEKIRFLRAFLRYELLCKIYHPRVWPSIDISCADQVKFMHEKLPPVEKKELYCVDEYFKGVYGAIFAHCQDSWLPDRPAPSSSDGVSKHGLLYPDTVHFSACDYFTDMDIQDLDKEDQIANNKLGPSYERTRRRSKKWQDYYWGRSLDNPLYVQEEEEEEAMVEDNEGHLTRFFEEPVTGKIPSF